MTEKFKSKRLVILIVYCINKQQTKTSVFCKTPLQKINRKSHICILQKYFYSYLTSKTAVWRLCREIICRAAMRICPLRVVNPLPPPLIPPTPKCASYSSFHILLHTLTCLSCVHKNKALIHSWRYMNTKIIVQIMFRFAIRLFRSYILLIKVHVNIVSSIYLSCNCDLYF